MLVDDIHLAWFLAAKYGEISDYDWIDGDWFLTSWGMILAVSCWGLSTEKIDSTTQNSMFA